MRRLFAIVLGLFLVVATASACPQMDIVVPQLPAPVEVKDDLTGKCDIGFVRIEDTVHIDDGFAVANYNEISAMLGVAAQVHQSYKLAISGTKIKIEKWEVGETHFLYKVSKDKAQVCTLPLIDIGSNYPTGLVTICCVKNPVYNDKGKPNPSKGEIDIAFRLVDMCGKIVVDDTTPGGVCILDSKIECRHCKVVVYDGHNCFVQDGCKCDKCSYGTNITDPCCDKSEFKYGEIKSKSCGQPNWIDPGEIGAGIVETAMSCKTTKYVLELKATTDWHDMAGDYFCGQVKIAVHPQL